MDLRKYCAEAVFGFAAAKTNLPVLKLADVVEHPAFDALEIQHEQLEAMPMFRLEALREHFSMIHAGELMEHSLSRGIVSAPEKIRNDFISESERLLDRIASGLHIRYVALDLDAGNAVADAERRKHLVHILRKLSPRLLENRQTLLLPFRLPVLSGCSARDFAVFLRETMLPCVKARLEIHPHECRRDSDPREIADNLRFETRSVMFCYDADSGNRLLEAHLTPWLRYFSLNAFRGPFFVCPYSQGFRLSSVEAGTFAELVEGFKGKRPGSGIPAHQSML